MFVELSAIHLQARRIKSKPLLIVVDQLPSDLASVGTMLVHRMEESTNVVDLHRRMRWILCRSITGRTGARM